MSPRLVGVLGGTFDPVHVGHVAAARQVRRLFRLERVLLVPAARPPHKDPAELTPIEHREAMLRLAVAEHEGLSVSRIEIERPGVGYTVETMRALRDGEPRLDPIFVVGRDSLDDLPGWHDWRGLVAEFDLVVVDRPEGRQGGGVERLHPEIRRRLVPLAPGVDPGGALPDLGRGGRVVLSPIRPPDASSRAIRRLIHDGGDPADLVPPPVARYIRDAGLYRQEGAS